MKFLNSQSGFEPFSIVVETQEEANYLYALVGGSNQEIDNALEFESHALFDFLSTKVKNGASLPTVVSEIVSEL